MWDFGEIREISDEDILGSLNSYPRMISLVGRSGMNCKIIVSGVHDYYGVYLGLAEDNYDHYYRVFTECNGKYREVLETCCSEIKFIDEFPDSEFSDKLMKEYTKYIGEVKP